MSSANSQAEFTMGNERLSIIGGTEFDFDQSLTETVPYRLAMAGALPPLEADLHSGILQNLPRKPLELGRTGGDKGYYGIETSRVAAPMKQLARKESTSSKTGIRHLIGPGHLGLEAKDIFRSRSLSSTNSPVSQPRPAIQRWLSLSSPSSPQSQVNKFSDLRKKRFWASLGRLNTTNKSSPKAHANTVQSLGPTYGSRHRGMRGQEMNPNQSIDFGGIDGLETPALVRAAQSGSRVEIERLHDSGYDIEAFHVPTRRTALAVAAHCGNLEIVETLIQLNAKLNSRDYMLSTPLHLAASRGHVDVMLLLLNEGALPEETDDKKRTALWIAAYHGHLGAVELLLQRGARINTRAEGQLCPLHAAAQRGDSQMTELLLCHKAQLEARDSQFMAALHYACENGHQAVVDILLEKEASIEVVGVDGRSPLICAAAGGQRHVVELLLRKKASIRSRDEGENNALHWAAYHGHVDVADLLLCKKLPINDKNVDGLTALHLAVIGSQFSAVEFLVRKNAKLEPQCRLGGMPMHYACGSTNADIVRLFLSAGAQAEAPVAGDLRKPIHIAASTGNVEIAQLLCEKGVALDIQDSAGDRPICIAAYHGHTELVEKLLDFKAALHLPFGDRSYEDSPLCVAAKEGNLGVVSALLQRGASVLQKDEHGWPPIRYAAHYGHSDVLELLLTQLSTLSDDIAGTSALDHISKCVGFAAGPNLSEERKSRVRELLSQAEDQINVYLAERTMRSTMLSSPDEPTSHVVELDINLSDKIQAMASYSQEMGATVASNGLSRSRTAFVPRRSDPDLLKYRTSSLEAFNDSKIDPALSRPSPTVTASDVTAPSPSPTIYKIPSRPNLAYNQPLGLPLSPHPSRMLRLSPEEVELLIENRRNEIAQLQLHLPSINEGAVHDIREYHAPAPMACETPS